MWHSWCSPYYRRSATGRAESVANRSWALVCLIFLHRYKGPTKYIVNVVGSKRHFTQHSTNKIDW